jgi:hypothetical protein
MKQNIHESTNPRNVDDALRARGRLSNARKWFTHLGWEVLPQNERGILHWAADHAWVAGPANRKQSVRRWCRRWAPWLSDADIADLIAHTERSSKNWSHDQSAAVLRVTVRDREALKLWFFGACDDPDYERRLQINREKAAARQRRSRAGRRTGRKPGRPKLNLTPEEMKARRNAQAAERMRRHRLRETPSRSIKNINPVTYLSVSDPCPILLPAPIEQRRAPQASRRLPDDVTEDAMIVDGGCALAPPPPHRTRRGSGSAILTTTRGPQ